MRQEVSAVSNKNYMPETQFTNLQILPARAKWRFLLRYTAVPIIFGFVFLMIIIIMGASGTVSGKVLGIIFLVLFIIETFLLAVVYLWAHLLYKSYKFQLAEEAFRKEYGVITKHYSTIPYDRIQNVDIRRGLLDRFMGLSALSIQTAGYAGGGAMGLGAEGHLPALLPKVAEAVRDELLLRARLK